MTVSTTTSFSGTMSKVVSLNMVVLRFVKVFLDVGCGWLVLSFRGIFDVTSLDEPVKRFFSDTDKGL